MRRSFLVFGTAFFVVILLLSGCGRENEKPSRAVKIMKYSDLGPPPAGERKRPSDVSSQERMIAKSATIDAEVEDCDSALDRVGEVIASTGGYVTRSSLEVGDAGRKVASLSARIPVGSFDSTMAVLPTLLADVKSVKVEGKDITDEFYDTVGRLANQRALEASYRAILSKATEVTDLLEVQKALSEVDGEIDRLEGRRQYLSGVAEFASISVNLREPSPVAVQPSPGLWQKLREAGAAGVEGLGGLLALMVTLLIVGVPTVVVLVIVCLVAIKVVKFARRRRKASQ